MDLVCQRRVLSVELRAQRIAGAQIGQLDLSAATPSVDGFVQCDLCVQGDDLRCPRDVNGVSLL